MRRYKKHSKDRIDATLDITLGPETEDNIKMIDFLKPTNL